MGRIFDRMFGRTPLDEEPLELTADMREPSPAEQERTKIVAFLRCRSDAICIDAANRIARGDHLL